MTDKEKIASLERELAAADLAIHDLQEESAAYQSGLSHAGHYVMRYPEGDCEVDGIIKSNQDIAKEIMTNKKPGAVFAMPSDRDDDGNYLWHLEYIGPDGSIAETVARLIEADPHQFSSRPCQTCRSISGVLGRPFGCNKK